MHVFIIIFSGVCVCVCVVCVVVYGLCLIQIKMMMMISSLVSGVPSRRLGIAARLPLVTTPGDSRRVEAGQDMY